MDIYAQNILDHYKNPRNKGILNGSSITHAEANYSCGDQLEVDLKIENNCIKDLRFRGGGCAISQAAMSIIGEYVIGKNIDDVLKINEQDIQNHLGVPIGERRRKCSLLNLLTIKNALLQYKKDPTLLKWFDLIEE
jgi:nitrogen fixation NifU-like protein